LREQGQFADALEALRRGHTLGSKAPGWRYPSADWVRHCERLVALDRDLPAILQGEKPPASTAERLEIATFCQRYKGRQAAATDFYTAAFAADPKVAADLNRQHRYNAACAAALASAGNALDTRGLAVEEWAWFQQHAHDWLRADLAVYTHVVEKADETLRQVIQQRLLHWQTDPDLLAVRAREWLAAMPAADSARWQQLWADVANLRSAVHARP
jgi:hypothetical protein